MTSERDKESPADALSDYDYALPESLIAQSPPPRRSGGRLMLLDAAHPTHHRIDDLPRLLRAGDLLVFNDTRVVPARLLGRKSSGGRVELMLERVLDQTRVLAWLRASRAPAIGSRLQFHGACEQIEVEVLARHDALYELGASAVDGSCSLPEFIERQGSLPLPPYIRRAPEADDLERYQTVYGRTPGAVAAPTAGLHFDEGLLEALSHRGIERCFVTLHVGAGTFQPVRVENIDEHRMHSERVSVPADTVEAVLGARAEGRRVVAVGTTSVRALESAARQNGGRDLDVYDGDTRLFLKPGDRFHVVDGLLTNFHLPRSTLLMLVSAFAGRGRILTAYEEAVRESYRFFSYGDAMLIWPLSEPPR